jgi:hypothetical protein
VHKINGVYCFMINDREDQEKFGNDGDGMQTATRYVLLQKARSADSSQLTLVFDDWEAFAGNSFASSTPNNNADQWDRTIRWAANHPWIELVNLKDVLGWAHGRSHVGGGSRLRLRQVVPDLRVAQAGQRAELRSLVLRLHARRPVSSSACRR